MRRERDPKSLLPNLALNRVQIHIRSYPMTSHIQHDSRRLSTIHPRTIAMSETCMRDEERVSECPVRHRHVFVDVWATMLLNDNMSSLDKD